MRPKLLIFINTLNFGGAERVVSQLLNNLNAEFEIHLALYYHQIKYDIPKEIKILDLKQNPAEGNIAILLKLPFIAHRLAAYCKEHEIQTSVAFLNRPCYINAFMKSLWGYKGKLIMCERSHQSSILKFIGGGSSIYQKITKKLISFSYNRADLVLTNSKISRLDLIENFDVKTNIEVIYNPIDNLNIERLAIEELPPFFEKDIFYFVTTGNFRIEKNFALLVSAFAKIKYLPVKLLLVGGGALEQSLRSQVKELGIEDKVVFTGFQENPFKYINGSGCFVLSSHTEGFPNVLIEALACGKAVISTDCKSGPRELLAPATNPGNQLSGKFELADFGILTPVNDVEILAAAMIKMYEDVQLRNQYESKAKARALQFDVDKIKKEFLKAFLLQSKD